MQIYLILGIVLLSANKIISLFNSVKSFSFLSIKYKFLKLNFTNLLAKLLPIDPAAPNIIIFESIKSFINSFSSLFDNLNLSLLEIILFS